MLTNRSVPTNTYCLMLPIRTLKRQFSRAPIVMAAGQRFHNLVQPCGFHLNQNLPLAGNRIGKLGKMGRTIVSFNNSGVHGASRLIGMGLNPS